MLRTDWNVTKSARLLGLVLVLVWLPPEQADQVKDLAKSYEATIKGQKKAK